MILKNKTPFYSYFNQEIVGIWSGVLSFFSVLLHFYICHVRIKNFQYIHKSLLDTPFADMVI